MTDPLELAVDALACWRITRLVTEDGITAPIRGRILDWALDQGADARPKHPKLAELIECPHCVSVYAAAGVLAARRYTPGLWDPLARLLAFSAVAGIVAEQT